MSQSPPKTPELAPDYYLANFHFMVNWVLQRYSDLLNDNEHQFLAAFQQLTRASQCLLVRLSSRKGTLFRSDKLHYAEIDSIEQAAQELITAGLLSSDSLLSISDAADLLTKVELLNLFSQDLIGIKQSRKEVLVAQLSELYPEPKTWQDWTNYQLGTAYRLDNQTIISNLLLLIFGNTYQELTEFVLQDLGLYRYENYSIDTQHRVFKTREELEEYQGLIQLHEQLEQADAIEHLAQIAELLLAAPQTISANTRIERRRARLCNQLAYELERANQHSLALALYTQSHLPPARERRIRLLEKQGDVYGAWQIVNAILQTPCNEHELQVAQRLAPRLAKKMGEQIIKKSPFSLREKTIQLPRLIDIEGNNLRVEEIVRQHLDHPESPCFYVENLLLSGLFGMWLWPEMFRGIDGAFANPFQAAPLDFYQDDFVIKRPGIDQLWQLLDNGQYQDQIRQIWREKNGITNHLVHWPFLEESLLDLALHAIPASHLTSVFKRILFDIKNNRSGLPDLIQFFPDEAPYKRYRMIEVKGPGDRIQDNQQRWLEYFSLTAIPAEVWYVSWQ